MEALPAQPIPNEPIEPDLRVGGVWRQLTFASSEGGTELTLHVELPANLPGDGVPGSWAYVENGWRDTVDRLAAQSG